MNRGKLFGTSGIRGLVDTDLTPDLCRGVGLAIAATLPQGSAVCVATDTRTSREAIKEAVCSGLLASGVNVTDVGIVPTPALALLTRLSGFAAGIMITASHNPPEFNGIKLFGGERPGYGQGWEEEVERVFFGKQFRHGKTGRMEYAPGMKERYFDFIEDSFAGAEPGRGLRVVVDPGNGAASGFAGDIFRRMGLDVIALNDEPDGRFPGRSPEPRADTLEGTVSFVRERGADLAVCFDGDADRVVFCDREGFLGFNECIAFISRLVISKTGRKRIATTVEAGTLLDLAVKDLGAEVVRGRVGDVAVAQLVRELDAALGVEEVGVYIIPEAGYHPDSIFASLTLLSELGEAGEIRQFFRGIPGLFFEKAKVSCPDDLKDSIMVRVEDSGHVFAPDRINGLDGLRMEFPNGWMLIRASGTEPVIRVVAESTSHAEANELVARGVRLVQNLVEAGR